MVGAHGRFDIANIRVDVGNSRTDVGQDAFPILDADLQPDGVGQGVLALVPFDVDAPLRVVQQVDDIRTGDRVHRHALAAGDISDDFLAADRIAAPRQDHHQVVDPADLDLLFTAGAKGTLDDARQSARGFFLQRVGPDDPGQHRAGRALSVADRGVDVVRFQRSEFNGHFG